jgi:leader peptidase (prepilin peptidase)/N-methyltransferase
MHPKLSLGLDAVKGRNEAIAYAMLFVGGTGLSILVLPTTSAALSAVWWALVLIIVRSDLTTFTIPDEANLAIAALGLVHAYLTADVASWAWHDVLDALRSGLLALSVFWIMRVGYRVWRGRDGLGFGDVKLAGACAVWMNPPDQIFALELAVASAAILVFLRGPRRSDAFIPFGAFLAPSAWLVFVGRSWFEAS